MEAAWRFFLIVGIFKIVVGFLVAMAGSLIVAFSLLTSASN